jgi:hypothetical protein
MTNKSIIKATKGWTTTNKTIKIKVNVPPESLNPQSKAIKGPVSP